MKKNICDLSIRFTHVPSYYTLIFFLVFSVSVESAQNSKKVNSKETKIESKPKTTVTESKTKTTVSDSKSILEEDFTLEPLGEGETLVNDPSKGKINEMYPEFKPPSATDESALLLRTHGRLESNEEISKIFNCRIFPENKKLPKNVLDLIQKASEQKEFIEQKRKKKKIPSVQYYAILKTEEGLLASHEWILLREVSRKMRQRKGEPASTLIRILDKFCK